MTPNLNAAVVGCGGAGSNHARGYELAEGVDLVAVCDLDETRARKLAEEHGVRSFTEQASMHEETRPDIVSVATPEAHHVAPAITALEADAHVLCEKIFAHSLEAGREMVDAVERANRTLAVDYNYRHIPVFERLIDATQDGELGEVRLVSMEVNAFCWHHALDLLRALLGEPRTVQATLDRDDQWAFWEYHDELLYVPAPTAAATLTFRDGSIASIGASQHGGGPDEQMIDLTIRGADGRAGVTGVRIEDTSGKPIDAALVDELAACEPITLAQSFHRSVDAFVTAVRAGSPPPTTGHDGLAVMEIERAVVEAARTGKRVEP